MPFKHALWAAVLTLAFMGVFAMVHAAPALAFGVAAVAISLTVLSRDSGTTIRAAYHLCIALFGAVAAFMLFGSAAHAATAVGVALQPIPWGDWLAKALLASTGLFTTVVTYLVWKYVPAAYRLFLTPQVIADAVHLAIATTAGAVKGETLSVQTTNEMLAQVEHWIVVEEPSVAKWLGDNLRPRIVAYLASLGMTAADSDGHKLALRRDA